MTEQGLVEAGAVAEICDEGGSLYPDSFEVIDGDRESGLLILADHAINTIPAEYGTLGLPEAELERHIACDIGVGPLTRDLADRLGAPALLTTFSRLLIDPNRGEDDPTLIMRLSDGAVVPGNARVDASERERRLNRFYRPYHAAIEQAIDASLAGGRAPALLSIHSYTPVWKGDHRPWHAGILWDRDPRLALPLLEGLRHEHGLRVGNNEPYAGTLKHDTMYRHGTQRGVAHALLEVRNDLIDSPPGVLEWADRLEPLLRDALKDPGLRDVHFYGSSVGDEEEDEDAANG